MLNNVALRAASKLERCRRTAAPEGFVMEAEPSSVGVTGEWSNVLTLVAVAEVMTVKNSPCRAQVA
jgi:hypothetical protein